jgi:1,2-phenylacetyl-CoA epoxidase catalytic subunit
MEHKDFTETIINLATGETTVRDFTQAEIDQIKAERAELLAKAEALEAKAADKAALLAKLGITEDEARLLLG